jgi:hypothetical protein
MTIKIAPKMPLMVVEPPRGVGLKRKENSDLSFTELDNHRSHKERESKGLFPQWDKGTFIDIYA